MVANFHEIIFINNNILQIFTMDAFYGKRTFTRFAHLNQFPRTITAMNRNIFPLNVFHTALSNNSFFGYKSLNFLLERFHFSTASLFTAPSIVKTSKQFLREHSNKTTFPSLINIFFNSILYHFYLG